MLLSSQLACRISRYHSHKISDFLKVSCKFKNCTSSNCCIQFSSSAIKNPEAINENYTHETQRFKKPEKLTEVKYNLKNYSENKIHFSQHDPDVFGSLSGTKLEEVEGDEGDAAEELYLEHPPFTNQKLRTKEYADLIKEFFKQKKLADALDVLETRMIKDDRVKPENYIYNLIIGECGRLGYTKKAFQLYNQMKKRDLKITGATYTGLFNACANSPWVEDGLKRAKHLRELIIQKSYEPNASNYHAMIKAFGRCGDLSTAFTLVDEMMEKQLPISNETFNFLFQACISDKEAGFRHALLVWRKMVNKGVKPDIYTYNLLLRSVRECGLGNLEVAQDVFHKIVQESHKKMFMNKSKEKKMLASGNQITLKSCPEEALPKEASTEEENKIGKESSENISVHEESFTAELDFSKDSIVPQIEENRPNLLARQPTFGNIIGLSQVTKPEDRLLLIGGCSGFLEQMKKDGVKQDIKTFTLLLDNIPQTKSAEQSLLTAMEKEGIQPDIDFYNILIKKRSMRFDYLSAREVLKLIQRAKLHPDIVTFGVLALGCVTREEAELLMTDMENAGFRMNAEILGAMVKQGCCHWNFAYVLFIMEVVIKEDIRPNEKFLSHLENFHTTCTKKLRYKQSTINGIDKNTFRIGFKKFCSRYTSWLNEVKPEDKVHPWDQFKKLPKVENTRNSRNVWKEKARSSS